MTATAATLVATARRLGARLEVRGPKLGIIPPPDVPPDEWAGLVDGLAEFKAEVLELLSGGHQVVTVPDPLVWSSPDCPAWCDDDSLSVSVEDVRRSVAEAAYLEIAADHPVFREIPVAYAPA
jgi:hypothetical protein